MKDPSRDRTTATRVLFLEPWLGGSHEAFASAWRQRSRHDLEVLGLPARHWRWRMESSAWDLARRVADLPTPDVIAVSDYVDLPRLIGFLPAAMRGCPTLAYFHENQLTYEERSGATAPSAVPRDPGAAFANVLTAVRADVLVFNSEHHRSTFAAAANRFLRTLPRPNPRAELEAAVARSHVVAPGPELGRVPLGEGPEHGAPLRVAFPHRLEADKDPLAFARAVLSATERGATIEVALAGGDPQQARGTAREALQLLEPLVVASGRADPESYLDRLGQCDLVASTAHHEFFGIAVTEAMAAGCTPLFPSRLNYPSLVQPLGEEAMLWGDQDELVQCLATCAAQPARFRERSRRARVRHSVMHLDAARCVDGLDGLIEDALTSSVRE